MTIIILTFVVFALALLGLSIGVIFGKRTPLKGSCNSVVKDPGVTILGAPTQSCESCSCHAKDNNRG